MKTKLAIIIPIYISKIEELKINMLSRPIEFLDIKLFSIQNQIDEYFDVRVIVSDMSPDSDISDQLKKITDKYNYEYIHSEVRDIWNKALCLNRGIKSVINDVEYVMTTDCDIFFSNMFFNRLYYKMLKKKNRVFLSQTFLLGEEKTNYFLTLSKEKKLQKEILYKENIENLKNFGKFAGLHANGGAQVFRSEWLHHIHGYDEEFKLWGGIDNEIVKRLEHMNINRYFLTPENTEILLCHMNHPKRLIDGINSEMKRNHQYKNLDKVKQLSKCYHVAVNPTGWGK